MIDALYRGEVAPCKADYRSDPTYNKAMEEIVPSEEALLKQLDEPNRQTLHLLTDAYARLGDSMTERAFHDGFCLAMELIFDVLHSRD